MKYTTPAVILASTALTFVGATVADAIRARNEHIIPAFQSARLWGGYQGDPGNYKVNYCCNYLVTCQTSTSKCTTTTNNNSPADCKASTEEITQPSSQKGCVYRTNAQPPTSCWESTWNPQPCKIKYKCKHIMMGGMGMCMIDNMAQVGTPPTAPQYCYDWDCPQ